MLIDLAEVELEASRIVAEHGDDYLLSLLLQRLKKCTQTSNVLELRLPSPMVNVHDNKGAPVLDIQRTLAHDHHNQRLGRK
jgi:hypothetical protein